MVRDAGRTFAQLAGRSALWLMPLTIVFEWVGGTFEKSGLDRALYLALFLGLFWLAGLTPRASLPLPSWLRKTLGGALLALGALLVHVALRWLFAARLGLEPFVPPADYATEKHRLLAPLLAAWPLALGHSLLRESSLSARAYEQLGLWLALGCLAHIATGVHVQGLPIVPSSTATTIVLSLSALSLAALLVVWRGSFAARLGVVLAAGFALRVLGLHAWEIDPRVRDMLALVASAQERFAAGLNPYAIYAMQHGSELPLTYFPGLWLGYGLPRLFGLDLRLLGPLAEVASLAALGFVATRVADERRAWAQAFVSCFAAAWLFSPSAQWNAIYAEPTLWWALLGALLTCAWSGRFTAAAILLGYAVATRHFAIVIAPFVLLYMVRTRGLRAALPPIALAGLIAAVMLTPFVVADAELFWFGTFRWLREYGPAHLSWFFDRFGFVKLFVERNALERMPTAQWSVVALCFAAALFVRRTFIPALAATAQLGFILLNVLLWDSFLLDGAMAAAAVIVTRPLLRAEPLTAVEPSARVLRASLVAIGLTALSGAYLAWTLVQTLRPSGHAPLHDYLVGAVRAEDFVIDRSDRRIAFVSGSWLLRKEEVPAPIGGALYDGAWGGGPALHAKGRVWLVTQQARDGALRESFARLGKVVEARRFGSLRLDAVAPYGMRLARPANTSAEVGMRHCRVGPTNWNMIAVSVSAEAPATVKLAPEKLGASVLLSAGFPNDDVLWPRKSVELAVHGASAKTAKLTVENLHGMQWRSIDTRAVSGEERALTIELRTRDELARTVCLELLTLDPR